MNLDWDTVLCDESANTNWVTLKLTISSEFTPKAIKKSTSHKPSWWTAQISKAVKPSIFTVHSAYAAKVKSMITSAKVGFDKTLIQNLTINPKALYGYV